MKISAKLSYLRIAPRKVRLVADLIRGKKVSEALVLLKFSSKRAARPLRKLVEQAIRNAEHGFQLTESNLYIDKISVDEGPKLKRWRARARGQAFEIQKKTSHIILVLDEADKKTKKIKKKRKAKKRRVEEPGKKKELPPVKKSPMEDKSPTTRAKLRPKLEIPKPKTEKGIRKFFRRKAF